MDRPYVKPGVAALPAQRVYAPVRPAAIPTAQAIAKNPRFLESLLPPVKHTDGKLLLLLLLPAGLMAGALYANGAKEAAIGLGVGAFLISLFMSPEIGFYIYCALQPFDQAFLQEQEAILTPSKVLAPLVLLSYVCRAPRARAPMIVSSSHFKAMMVYGLYGILSSGIAIAPLAALRFGGQVVVQVMLVAVCLLRLTDRLFIQRALLFTVAGSLASGILVSLGIGSSSRIGGRSTLGEFANPNTVALSICLGLICIPAAWAYTRNKFIQLALLASVPPMLMGILKTGSRTGLLSAFGSVMLGMVFARGSGFVRRIMIPGVFLVTAAASAVVVLNARVLEQGSQERLEELLRERSAGKGEARQFIWSTAINTYITMPLGFGYGNTTFTLSERRGHFVDIHSTYLAALVEGGPIGFVSFMLGMWFLFRAVWGINQATPGIGAAIIFGFVIIEGAVHTLQYAKWFWIPVTLCLLLCEQTQREKNAIAQYQQRLRLRQAHPPQPGPHWAAPAGPRRPPMRPVVPGQPTAQPAPTA